MSQRKTPQNLLGNLLYVKAHLVRSFFSSGNLIAEFFFQIQYTFLRTPYFINYFLIKRDYLNCNFFQNINILIFSYHR